MTVSAARNLLFKHIGLENGCGRWNRIPTHSNIISQYVLNGLMNAVAYRLFVPASIVLSIQIHLSNTSRCIWVKQEADPCLLPAKTLQWFSICLKEQPNIFSWMYKDLPLGLHPALQLPFLPLACFEIYYDLTCIYTSPLWNITFSYLLLFSLLGYLLSLLLKWPLLILQDKAEVPSCLRSSPELYLFPVSS